jgi:hypothetical protein
MNLVQKQMIGNFLIQIQLKSFFYMYGQGVRSFLILGYGLAPFFWLFELLPAPGKIGA